MAVRALFRNSILFLLFSSCQPPAQIEVGDPMLTKQKGKYYYDGDLYSGLLLGYNEAGDLINKAEITQGQRDGLFEQWWDNGQRRMVAEFREGEYDGEVICYYENGALYSKFHYEAGHESGLQQMWKSDGRIKANYEVIGGRKYGLTGVKNCSNVFEENGGH